MRELTKTLKKEAQKDKIKMYSHNNHKMATRTAEENEKARADKVAHYKHKWEWLLEQSETKAQKECCLDMLGRLHVIK